MGLGLSLAGGLAAGAALRPATPEPMYTPKQEPSYAYNPPPPEPPPLPPAPPAPPPPPASAPVPPPPPITAPTPQPAPVFTPPQPPQEPISTPSPQSASRDRFAPQTQSEGMSGGISNLFGGYEAPAYQEPVQQFDFASQYLKDNRIQTPSLNDANIQAMMANNPFANMQATQGLGNAAGMTPNANSNNPMQAMLLSGGYTQGPSNNRVFNPTEGANLNISAPPPPETVYTPAEIPNYFSQQFSPDAFQSEPTPFHGFNQQQDEFSYEQMFAKGGLIDLLRRR